MRSATILFAALGMFLCCASAFAQAPPGPLPPKPGVQPQQGPPQKELKEKPQIRVRVDLVHTPVTVRDDKGEIVYDLAQKDFRVFDNGVLQNIENFDLGGEPISAVLVLEASSRVEPLMAAVRKTGIIFTQTVLGPSGESAVISYDDTINSLLPLTSNQDQIEKIVSTFRMGTGGARLYDAIGQGISLLGDRPRERRRVILVVGEAYDTGSAATLGSVLREAQLANVTIYTVGLSTTAAQLRADPKPVGPQISPPGTFGLPKIPGSVQTPGTEQQRHGNMDLLALLVWLVTHATNALTDNPLELATAGTGGLHMPTYKDRTIERAMDQIGAELHAQYSLSYRPAGSAAIGYHEIKIMVARTGVKVRARPGYYIPPDS
ncbi:MAG: VWA domain-containing protein [Acidobacteria bacterium]|nr:VWA domain-containing protein [Acidobacteriota bacterium]